MKLPATAVILLLLLLLNCHRQAAAAPPAPDAGARFLEQAQSNVDAMIAGDYDAVIKFTYPPIVEQLGGADRAVRTMKSVMAKMQSDGMRITAITLGAASRIVHEASGDVALVPTTSKMKFNDKAVTQHSYLIGVSQDQGATWTFIDGNQLPPDKAALIFPRLAAAVDIPRPGNSLEDEIMSNVQKIEQREGKPIDQILGERLAEDRRIIEKIQKAGLRNRVEASEGKSLEQITTTRLKEILRAHGLE